MKKYLNKKTIFFIISVLIIVSGIITVAISGFEKSIEYKAGTRIEVYIPQGFEKQDIIEIARKSFETDELLLLDVEQTNQVAGIKILDYSKEQLENYINNINEKYGIKDEDKKNYEILVPETRIRTLVQPYILPIIFTTTISLIYIVSRNYNTINGVKIPLRILTVLGIVLGLYFSFIALLKIQFSIYTMPIALAIYMILLIMLVNKKCE